MGRSMGKEQTVVILAKPNQVTQVLLSLAQLGSRKNENDESIKSAPIPHNSLSKESLNLRFSMDFWELGEVCPIQWGYSIPDFVCSLCQLGSLS
eukprot:1134635-Pelagomonas_calceolata.AAC.1